MKSMRDLITRLMNDPRYREQYEQTVNEILHFPAVKAFIEANEGQLSSEMIADSMSKLNEYMLEMKAIDRGESGKNPGFTPKLYINYNYIDVTYVPTQAYLAQQQKRRTAHLLDNRMMSADVRNASLQAYETNTADRIALMEEIAEFIGNYESNPSQARGLYITGPFGVGKTYALGALANFLVTLNRTVTMIHYPTFSNEIKQTIAQNTTHQVLDKVKKADVLIIDDIGAESNTPWLRDDVLSVLLEYRMKEVLPTFFTSNFSMEDLEGHLASTREALDKVKAKRLMERIHFLAKEVHLSGENRRHKGR